MFFSWARQLSKNINLKLSEIKKDGIEVEGLCALLLERSNTLCELSNELSTYLFKPKNISLRELFESSSYYKNRVSSEQLLYDIVNDFLNNLPDDWTLEGLSGHLKTTLSTWNLKMPQLAIPLRVIVLGQYKSPAIEKVLFLLGGDEVKKRLRNFLGEYVNER